MKNIINYVMFIAFGLVLVQCVDDKNLTLDSPVGGLISFPSSNLNYVVGNGGTYSFDMNVLQNVDNPVSTVTLYKSATIKNKVTGELEQTNEVEAQIIEVGGDSRKLISSKEFSYADLIDGLTVNGTALPASDGDLSIGDNFAFRVVSNLASGENHEQANQVNMTVSTRYAGTYISTNLEYYRIGVQSPSYWEGEEVTVRSIDAITYLYDWGVSIGWTGPLYFQVDADNNITYPAEWDGVAVVLNDQPLITCATSMDLTNVPCDGSNIVIKDDVNGKDQLVLTYGYFTAGSGPREFTETLIKK